MTECQTIGIDGKTIAAPLPHDCECPIPPCAIDDCAFICSFVEAALPDGPLWDAAKKTYNEQSATSCGVVCSSLVSHAAFVAKTTLFYIRAALWPAVREASPFTSWTTRQYWLDRWGWSNCFLDPERSEALGPLTPYELPAAASCDNVQEQGANALVVAPSANRVLSPPAIPQPLQDAVTKGLITALARRSLGPIPSIDSLNFIIAPLGAAVTVEEPFDVWSAVEARANSYCTVVASDGTTSKSPAGLAVEDFEEQGTGARFDPIKGPFNNYCRGASQVCGGPISIVSADGEQGQNDGECCIYDIPLFLTIAPSSDTILADQEAECPTVTPGYTDDAFDIACGTAKLNTVPAYIEPCDPARPARIYPGVLAAECLVRSILPDTMTYTLKRCPEPMYDRPCP